MSCMRDDNNRHISPPRPLRDPEPCYYSDYLSLDALLSCQHLRSRRPGRMESHDETLFIITHQTYELWFKQILHELSSCMTCLMEPDHHLQLINERLQRVIKIQTVLISQLSILETMTSIDFLSFRDYLFPASGFQSIQFKLIETMLGLSASSRLLFNNNTYISTLKAEHQLLIESAASQPSMFNHMERLLTELAQQMEMDYEGDFIGNELQPAIQLMQQENRQHIESITSMSSEAIAQAMKSIDDQDDVFRDIFQPDRYQSLIDRGLRRLSFSAFRAAVIVNLYRHEPRFTQCYRLLNNLIEIDSHLSKWRFNHASMVHKFLGFKPGTGGSSGVSYLRATCSRHIIYGDLFAISGYMIPSACLPPLPQSLRR